MEMNYQEKYEQGIKYDWEQRKLGALEIADRLGHESVKTTLDTYSHLYPDKDQKLAHRLNQFRRTTSEGESY